MTDYPEKKPTLRHLGKYRATIQIRRNPDRFGEIRPAMVAYDGVSTTFREIWFIDCNDDEFANPGYHGEHAMECPREWPINWLASGDLTNIVPIDGGPIGPDDGSDEEVPIEAAAA